MYSLTLSLTKISELAPPLSLFDIRISTFLFYLQVKLSGENAPKGVLSFEEMQLRPILLDNIKKSGYQKPTPIQKTAIPCIMAKRDLMGCAQTGSGKTAVRHQQLFRFVLPFFSLTYSRNIFSSLGFLIANYSQDT